MDNLVAIYIRSIISKAKSILAIPMLEPSALYKIYCLNHDHRNGLVYLRVQTNIQDDFFIRVFNLISSEQGILNPTLKTPLYLMFTTEKWQCGISMQ